MYYVVTYRNRQTDDVEILSGSAVEHEAMELSAHLRQNRCWHEDEFPVLRVETRTAQDFLLHPSQVLPPSSQDRLYYKFTDLDYDETGTWTYRNHIRPVEAVSAPFEYWIRADSDEDALRAYRHYRRETWL